MRLGRLFKTKTSSDQPSTMQRPRNTGLSNVNGEIVFVFLSVKEMNDNSGDWATKYKALMLLAGGWTSQA